MNEQGTRLLEAIGLEKRFGRVQALQGGYPDGRRELFLLDQPTAALGGEEVRKVLALIGNLKAEGQTMMVISHDPEHVFQAADRTAVMLRQGPGDPPDRRRHQDGHRAHPKELQHHARHNPAGGGHQIVPETT